MEEEKKNSEDKSGNDSLSDAETHAMNENISLQNSPGNDQPKTETVEKKDAVNS